jgi:DNA invertase Pin-like site-specific DNA recombinase
MNETQYRAVKYIRLSDADNKRDKNGNRVEKLESDSISNQRKFIEDWLKGHPDIDAVSEKIDDGWSGLLFDRPAFQDMMSEMTAGRANCCITKDASACSKTKYCTKTNNMS